MGPIAPLYDLNGDLYQQYLNGVPTFALVFNTPVYGIERLNADMGTFIQDSWTRNRFTVSAGVRFEHFNASIQEQGVPGGRFAPPRVLERVPNMPNWNDVTPRLGITYDLFGNAKTALKGSFNKYMAGQTTAFPQRYNPLALQFETRSWADRNGDDIAQDSEIGLPVNNRFGLPTSSIIPDPDLKREYDFVYSLGVQHEIATGFAGTVTWGRRDVRHMRRTDNRLVSLTDYTPIDIFNPLDGSKFTIYNLAPAKFGQVDRIDVTATDSDLRRRSIQGVEFGFNARVKNITAFGAYSLGRELNTCTAMAPTKARRSRRRWPPTPTPCGSATIGGT